MLAIVDDNHVVVAGAGESWLDVAVGVAILPPAAEPDIHVRAAQTRQALSGHGRQAPGLLVPLRTAVDLP